MVQLTWPHEKTDWADTLKAITQTYIRMAVEIAVRERLLIVAPEPADALRAIRPYATAAIMDNIVTFACATNDTWARDHAFITLTNGSKRRYVDFCFNGWGNKYESSLDNAINSKLFKAKILPEGEYADSRDFVLEGGSIESDGNGTIYTTRQCLLAPNRNQPLSEQDIERQLKARLGAKRIVWFDTPVLAGDDTDGHIDTVIRTAPSGTLLVDERVMTADIATSAKNVVTLPSPTTVTEGGETLPATYANFLAINGAVLVPTYNQSDNDQRAMRVIAAAFPDRDIIPIDCRSVIVQHGSLHCCTMQYPQ